MNSWSFAQISSRLDKKCVKKSPNIQLMVDFIGLVVVCKELIYDIFTFQILNATKCKNRISIMHNLERRDFCSFLDRLPSAVMVFTDIGFHYISGILLRCHNFIHVVQTILSAMCSRFQYAISTTDSYLIFVYIPNKCLIFSACFPLAWCQY